MKNNKLNWIAASTLGFGLTVAAPAFASGDGVQLELEERAYPASSPASNTAAQGRTTAESLRFWQDKLASYKRMGGPAYKSGLVRDAEYKVAFYQRQLAEENGTAVTPAPSPAAALPHEARAEQLKRNMAGAGYKTGLVQSAEAQARKNGSTIGLVDSNIVPGDGVAPSKPAVQILNRSGS